MTSKKDWPPRCCLCNPYISYADSENGEVLIWDCPPRFDAIEPPSPTYAHLTCWKNPKNSGDVVLWKQLARTKPQRTVYDGK